MAIWRDQRHENLDPDAAKGVGFPLDKSSVGIRHLAEAEGEDLPVELHLVNPPKPGHTLRVLVIDRNPIDRFNNTDELRFRDKRCAVGYQSGSSYVIDIDTSDPFMRYVTTWERPSIRFYRDYGPAGFRRKTILRFNWVEEPLMLTGKSRRKLVELKLGVDPSV